MGVYIHLFVCFNATQQAAGHSYCNSAEGRLVRLVSINGAEHSVGGAQWERMEAGHMGGEANRQVTHHQAQMGGVPHDVSLPGAWAGASIPTTVLATR